LAAAMDTDGSAARGVSTTAGRLAAAAAACSRRRARADDVHCGILLCGALDSSARGASGGAAARTRRGGAGGVGCAAAASTPSGATGRSPPRRTCARAVRPPAARLTPAARAATDGRGRGRCGRHGIGIATARSAVQTGGEGGVECGGVVEPQVRQRIRHARLLREPPAAEAGAQLVHVSRQRRMGQKSGSLGGVGAVGNGDGGGGRRQDIGWGAPLRTRQWQCGGRLHLLQPRARWSERGVRAGALLRAR